MGGGKRWESSREGVLATRRAAAGNMGTHLVPELERIALLPP